MLKSFFSISKLGKCRVGITGATGSLGLELIKSLKEEGAFVIGLTHKEPPKDIPSENSPQEWVRWQCGEEKSLESTLSKLDILVLNHGINTKGRNSFKDLDTSIEVNALSSWRLIEIFKNISIKSSSKNIQREIWVNTSEAEIQPALSPSYEISKRLIGELVSITRNSLNKEEKELLKIRKLILGPFKSELNPIGLMNAKFVAKQIIFLAKLNINLIIVTPNPLTYITMPVFELGRFFYYQITKRE